MSTLLETLDVKLQLDKNVIREYQEHETEYKQILEKFITRRAIVKQQKNRLDNSLFSSISAIQSSSQTANISEEEIDELVYEIS